MSTSFLVSLAAVVFVVMAVRLVVPALPLRAVARPLTVPDTLLVAVGLIMLAFHCVAMFFRDRVDPLPGTSAIIEDIRALGTPSMIWFIVPAGLLLLGLRRLHPVAFVVASLSLAAVGVTMYNDGSLQVHLIAIFVAVTALAGIAAALVRLPRQPASAP